MHTTPTAADLRAEVARRRVKLYILAARIGLHPVHLGMIVNGRRPLQPEMAERIMRAIGAEAPPAA